MTSHDRAQAIEAIEAIEATKARQAIEALDEPTLHVLQAVSALRRVLIRDVPLLFGEQSRYLQRAIQAGVVSSNGSYLQPADPQTGAAALQSLAEPDRRALHLRLARLSVSEYDSGRQRDLGTPAGQDIELAITLERIATRAEQLGHVDVAIEFWGRAARRSVHGTAERHDRELRLAAQEHTNGHFQRAVEILEALTWSDLSSDQAERAIDLVTSATYKTAGLAAARLRAEQHRESLPPSHPHREMLDIYLAGLGENFSEVAEQLEAALPVLRSGHYSAAFRHAIINKLLYAKVNTGDGLDRELLDELEHLQNDLAELLLEDTVEAKVAVYAYTVDDIASSRSAIASMLVKCEVSGDTGFRQSLLVHAAHVDISTGKFTSADERLKQSASLSPRSSAAPATVRASGLLALELGRYDEVTQIIGRVPDVGVAPLGHLTRAALRGILLSRSGDAPAAIRHLEDALRTAEGLGIREPGRRLWLDVDLARAHLQNGDVDRAQSVATSLRGIADRTGRALPRLQARRVEAWLEAEGGSPRSLVASTLALVAAAETMEWVPERARLITEALRMLRDIPLDNAQRSRIAHTARGALAVLEDGVARRELSTELSRWERSKLSALTPSERRVAELIAQGLTNRLAGEALHLSPRTIESHLRNAFIKLGVSNRTQLIAQFYPLTDTRAA